MTIKKIEDLNKESITKVFRDYLKVKIFFILIYLPCFLDKLIQDDHLEVIELSGNREMVGENDNFVSDIRAWNTRVKLKDGTEKEVKKLSVFFLPHIHIGSKIF